MNTANDPTTRPIVQADQLCFGWPDHALFSGLSFGIPPGLSLVRGDDGCGKSSLLRLMAGEWAPSSGTVSIHGTRLDEAPSAYRPQVFWIDPATDAHDAISPAAFLAHLGQQAPGLNTRTLADLVAGFGLAPHLDKPMYMLSTGSKRKVWLSAAWAAGTPLTLIDQPFAALDAPSIRLLTELLQEAASHPSRAWVIADHTAPAGLAFASVIDL